MTRRVGLRRCRILLEERSESGWSAWGTVWGAIEPDLNTDTTRIRIPWCRGVNARMRARLYDRVWRITGVVEPAWGRQELQLLCVEESLP